MAVTSPNTTPDPEADLAFLHKAIVKPREEDGVVKKLALHLDRVWKRNQADCQGMRRDMVAILRRVRGEYDAEKLAAIKAFQGSETFIRSSENKARSAESWIKDIYQGDTDLPWDIEPTSEPELPDETHEEIEGKVRVKAEEMRQQIILSGAPVNQMELADLLQRYYEKELDLACDAMKKEAKDRCRRAASIIRDQNQEGGWDNAFKEFLYWFVRAKFAVIKGPVLTRKKKRVWQPAPDGGFALETIDTIATDVYCVSPFNFYPSFGMKDVNNGDTVEVHELTRQSLSGMIGVPGYSEDEIRTVLAKYRAGELKGKWLTIDDETSVNQVTRTKSVYQTTPSTQNAAPDSFDTIRALEFYGSVSGAMLIEWGAKGELDPEQEYQANCWKIGDHVIKAVVNPDPLGRKPYHVSSWAKNPESIIGEGLIEFAAPVEDAINAVVRALINNVAIASGPMAEVDKDRVDTKLPIHPWRQIESTAMQMRGDGPAVNYYQPQMHAQELITVWQQFSKVLDEMTVPAYAQGASQSGVTAGTATVFTQLLAAASRSIKGTVGNLDADVITPYFQMCYDYLMRFTKDPSLKGDAQVVAKGVEGLLAREQQAQRKVEYLQVVANPSFTQVLGAKNIGAILAQVARSNDIKLPDLDRLEGNPDVEQELMGLIQAQVGYDPMQAQGQIGAGGGEPAEAEGTNPDGSKAGVNNG